MAEARQQAVHLDIPDFELSKTGFKADSQESGRQRMPGKWSIGAGAADENAPLLSPTDSEAQTSGGTSGQDEDKKKEKPMGLVKWMKKQAKSMKKESLAVFYAMQDRRTPWYAKILPFLALSYALCPLDLIPDFIPVLGLVDDILIVPGLLWLSFFLIPKDVMADARQHAKNNPMRLDRNWVAAVIVFLIWMGCLEGTIYWLATEFFWNMGPVRAGLWYFMGFIFVVGAFTFVSWMKEKAAKEKEKARKAAAAAAAVADKEAERDGEVWEGRSPRKSVKGSVENV